MTSETVTFEIPNKEYSAWCETAFALSMTLGMPCVRLSTPIATSTDLM